MCVDYYVEKKKWVAICKTKKEKKEKNPVLMTSVIKVGCRLNKPPPDKSVPQCSCSTANFHGVWETECLIYFHPQILFIVLYIIICIEGFHLAVQLNPNPNKKEPFIKCNCSFVSQGRMKIHLPFHVISCVRHSSCCVSIISLTSDEDLHLDLHSWTTKIITCTYLCVSWN